MKWLFKNVVRVLPKLNQRFNEISENTWKSNVYKTYFFYSLFLKKSRYVKICITQAAKERFWAGSEFKMQ